MNLATLADFMKTAVIHPRVWRHEVEYLFLMSHMRSRSSLISHILGSHPEIVGDREWHQRYATLKDFFRLRYSTWKEFRWDDPRYLLDKILHNEHTPTKDCLNKHPIRVLVFLREPGETLRSIVNLGIKRQRPHFSDPEWALRYYCKRLERITDIVEALPADRWFYFRSRHLVENPNQVLLDLTSFLQLKTPLSENYRISNGTGKPGLGDSGKHILAGRILKLDPSRHADIEIDPKHLQQAQRTFEETTRRLESLKQAG